MNLAYLFNTGQNYQSYNFLGVFPIDVEQPNLGCVFSVWAPRARSVYVVGDFSKWARNDFPMKKDDQTGVWTCTVQSARLWDRYKYLIIGQDGNERLKVDPFARHCETRPNDASIIYYSPPFEWTDDSYRASQSPARSVRPLNIYEVHLGSWRRHQDQSFMNYRTIANDLAAYCKDMGYTHVELMPVMEHPLDDSWGYQVIAFYAVTSRFGTPDDFKYFVNHLHENNIGVILDWVPAHFPKNEEGLVQFDGSSCYEYEDPRIGEHKEWGTYVFDFGKAEVKSFLISNAVFWIDEYHVDGIRVDAVSSMIYRNYARTDFIPNVHGGVENYEAMELLKTLNGWVQCHYGHVMMIAEESTAWPMVTHSTDSGGLGFSHKWNMGWMHDSLDYFKMDYYARKWSHDKFCFSMVYAFSEQFVLPLSHDEVVHGKKSLLDKMPGDPWRKFASLRTLYMYMMAHPGGKLFFMGSEFGPYIEWRFYEELEWFLLEYDVHRKMQDFSRSLNHFYLNSEALWTQDHSWDGFEWIDTSDWKNSVYIIRRKSGVSDNDIYVVLNMVPVPLDAYHVPVWEDGEYEVVYNSDDSDFGGSGYNLSENNSKRFIAQRKDTKGKPHYIEVNLPPLSGLYISKYGQQQTLTEVL